MDLKNKFFAGLFALALVTVSGCSSGQVDETGAPLESVDEGSDQVTADASTDAAPVGEDAGLDDPNAVAPPSDTVMATGDEPPADTVMATSEEPNLDTAPAPMTESGPVADAAPAEVAPLADAPPTAETSAEIPVDTATVAEPAPVADSTIDMAAATDTSAATDEDTGSKKKKKKKYGGASMAASGDGMSYQVRKGDTLMKIAFENYGDLYRWREIYEANRDQIQDPNHVPPGTELTLNGAGMVTIERNGEQYLIKHGDTLGTISNDVYGTSRKWKRLWENNRQLIKDPNKIYAGFYLYYQPDGKLTNDAGGGEDSAQNVPAEAPAQEIVQQAQAPAQNVAAAQTQPAAAQERAPASAPAQAPAQPATGQ
ncbi:MAG: LysM peptidoglycan-binding domain-containing protein [Bdellovibrionales bacterium]|nr:LysM peptidoglycan-binding domain-containing protein [Bdellovibrionales bacterium]